jgi:type II secretory pathway pseudopilin PulG
MEEIIPYLERMQRLLSQRGADRRMVLKRAGLPAWTEWAERYARSLHCTLRTVQRHILLVREGQEPKALGPASPDEGVAGGALKRVRLDARQQAALLRAQLAANRLAEALRVGADWHAALAGFEKATVAQPTLDAWLSALNPEPDWRAALVGLVEALEPFDRTLPSPAMTALHAAKALLSWDTPSGAACAGPEWSGLETSSTAARTQTPGELASAATRRCSAGMTDTIINGGCVEVLAES